MFQRAFKMFAIQWIYYIRQPMPLLLRWMMRNETHLQIVSHQKYFIWSIMLFDWYIVLILFPIFIEFDCQEWMRFAHKQAGVQIERFAHKHIYSSNGIEGNTKNYAKFFSIYFLMSNMYMMMVCILLSSDHLNAVLHVVKNSRLAHSNRQ